MRWTSDGSELKVKRRTTLNFQVKFSVYEKENSVPKSVKKLKEKIFSGEKSRQGYEKLAE